MLLAALLPVAVRATVPDAVGNATSNDAKPPAPTLVKDDSNKVALDIFEEESAYVGGSTFRESPACRAGSTAEADAGGTTSTSPLPRGRSLSMVQASPSVIALA